MSARLGLSSLRARLPTSRTLVRRNQSTTAAPPPPSAKPSAFRTWVNSETGPFTVHFLAPVAKWGLVIAGAADFVRPAESLSISQSAALMATGAIWTRWCFIIKPKNIFLASVNFLLFCVNAVQLSRALIYRRSLQGKVDGSIETAKEKITQAAS